MIRNANLTLIFPKKKNKNQEQSETPLIKLLSDSLVPHVSCIFII